MSARGEQALCRRRLLRRLPLQLRPLDGDAALPVVQQTHGTGSPGSPGSPALGDQTSQKTAETAVVKSCGYRPAAGEGLICCVL